MKFRRLLAILLCSAGAASAAGAQVSLLIGAGRPVDADGPVALKTSNIQAGIQFDVPVLPFAVRAEAMVSGDDIRNSPRSIFATAIVPIRAPVVQPYGILSYGAYSWGKSTEVRGINYGGGIRLGVSRLGIYGEMRRHEKLNRTMATIGVTL
ncbi:MAG: hypothetical protein ACT4OZ_15065 [Gemmatimonadota bacterium]